MKTPYSLHERLNLVKNRTQLSIFKVMIHLMNKPSKIHTYIFEIEKVCNIKRNSSMKYTHLLDKLFSILLKIVLMIPVGVNLYNYFNFHVCLSIRFRSSVRSCVQKLAQFTSEGHKMSLAKVAWYVLGMKNTHSGSPSDPCTGVHEAR